MTSLYVHIPFCKKKCFYCDFVSYAGQEDLINEYVEALCQEIRVRLSTYNLRGMAGRPATIYFGGGTPTLLEPKHFNKIISTLIGHWELDIGNSETSVEANPGTADLKKLKALRGLGINRLSIGVQSFNNHHLKTLGRIHSAEEAIDFYRQARSAGFDNINLDLIFALPGQTFEDWQNDLQTAIQLNPEHLSVYNLQLEEGTPLFTNIKNQKPSSKQSQSPKLELPNEDEEASMYEYSIDQLTSVGYRHYEISNFAKPGYECRHNINYWRNGNYLGVGAGAHSHLNGQRWANETDLAAYIATVNQRLATKGSIADDQKEGLFLGLRLIAGLPSKRFKGFENEVSELIGDGLLRKNNGHYSLTRRGLLLGNLVFEKFV